MDKKIIIESAIFLHMGLAVYLLTDYKIIPFLLIATSFSSLITPYCISCRIYESLKGEGAD